eukprot:gene41272-50372_t
MSITPVLREVSRRFVSRREVGRTPGIDSVTIHYEDTYEITQEVDREATLASMTPDQKVRAMLIAGLQRRAEEAKGYVDKVYSAIGGDPSASMEVKSALVAAVFNLRFEANPKEAAAFLATLAHESAGFSRMEESGNAAYFARYDNLAVLGNNQPNDGYKYRGRGFVQLTGRDNYTRAGAALGLDLVNQPELAAQPGNAAKIAMWFWTTKKCGEPAARGDMEQVTRIINGGVNGLADRLRRYNAALEALK